VGFVAGVVVDVNENTFEKAWNSIAPQVSVRCRQLTRDNHDAGDLYQRTAIRAWRGHASFRGSSSYLTWVMRIADREAARLGARRELLAHREFRLDPRYADKQLTVESETDGEHADADWLRLALADALAFGAISATEQQVMAERLAHPAESWPDIAARLAMTPTACAVAHSRAVTKLRVFLFTSRPALLGGNAAIAEGFAQAGQDRSAPLTELEVEAFEQLVIRRRPGYRRRGSRAALRGACAKVAAHMPMP
jgi:RNA polymerase sigma factor (sigma-70 family)